MNETDFFYRLTPDEILDALTRLGLDATGHISQLNSMENRVFDLRLADGSHVVAKFYRPGRWNRAQILEEHKFLFELTADEIPVLAPIEFAGKSLFEEQGIFFALWKRTGGREPDELTEIDLQILGRLLARLHNRGAVEPMVERPNFSTARFVYEPLALITEKNFLPPEYLAPYTEIARSVAENFDAHYAEVPLIRIHGDLHKGNMLNGNDGWFLLDFDDSLNGPAAQDIWMLFPGNSANALAQREIFLEAYREFREFDNRWLGLAETLRAMRIIHYSGWIARRHDDPAFKSAFQNFADNAYWEEEINILREICSTFHGAGETATHSDDKLQNSDFFFDWDSP